MAGAFYMMVLDWDMFSTDTADPQAILNLMRQHF